MGRAEVPHGCTPYAIVFGWIGRDHAGFPMIRRRLGGGLSRRYCIGALSKIRADPGIMQYRDDLSIRADDVAAVRLPRHRLLPKLGVKRVWIGTVLVQKCLLPGSQIGHGATLILLRRLCHNFGPGRGAMKPRPEFGRPLVRVMAGEDDSGEGSGDVGIREFSGHRLHLVRRIEAGGRGWEGGRALDLCRVMFEPLCVIEGDRSDDATAVAVGSSEAAFLDGTLRKDDLLAERAHPY